MLFASTHSPFTRTHSNHKLQPNSRNTASKHITAASAAQPTPHWIKHLSLPITFNSHRVPWRRNASIWGFMATVTPLSSSRSTEKMSWWNNEEVYGTRQSAKLLFWKAWWPWFRRAYSLPVSLSKQALQFVCFGSHLGFVVCVFRLSGHHGCAMLSDRRDVRNKLLRWRCNL